MGGQLAITVCYLRCVASLSLLPLCLPFPPHLTPSHAAHGCNLFSVSRRIGNEFGLTHSPKFIAECHLGTRSLDQTVYWLEQSRKAAIRFHDDVAVTDVKVYAGLNMCLLKLSRTFLRCVWMYACALLSVSTVDGKTRFF